MSTVHADLLIMEAQVGQLQAQLAQTQTELQYAIEQIRILTLQVNRNTSAVTTAATTTEPAATSAGYHSRMPKVNHQFGKDIIPNIFDGKQRNDFREWAENSALYLSSQCVDACEILLEWLVMEKEHVTETAIQVKCEEEDWEYDSVSTFSRVTFVYLSMRTTGTARKIATSGKRGDGLNAWRRLFQEYNPQLVTGAQALLRRALSMGRAKNVADVSDRIQELEELVRKYEEHEGCTFPAAFKIQKLMDILPEDAERQLTLESTNTKPNFESLKSRVSQWVLLNHRGRSAMDCSHVGNGGHSGDRDAQMSEHEDNSTWSGRGSEGHDWSGREEEESQEGYPENQSSYLGYNGMGHHDNEGISGITKGKGKGKKGSGKGFGKQFQGYCNACGMWGHKAIDCKAQGKGKDNARWYPGNRNKGPGKGGTKGWTKGKGKGMNSCEYGQRRLQAPSPSYDVLLLERTKETEHDTSERKQHIHDSRSTETRTTSDQHQQWRVPVKRIQALAENDKKKLQVRNRFEALRTDDEEFPLSDEYDDPGLSETIAKKQRQGGIQNPTHKHRTMSARSSLSGDGNEVNLCPLERGKMLGSTEEGEDWRLMPRPLVIDSGAAETVLPTDWFTGHELKETEESRGGQFYVCAGGKEIPNYGERTLTLSTLDWSSVRNMTFQVTDVTKALGSVSKIVANGNKVVFDESGSFIENKRSRERLWMREDNGVYVLDVYVAPPDCHEKNVGFHRQGIR